MSAAQTAVSDAAIAGTGTTANSSRVANVLPPGELPAWCTIPPQPLRYLSCGRQVSPDAATCPYRQYGDATMQFRRQVLRDTLTALSGQRALESCTERALANLAEWSKQASPVTRQLQVLPGDWGDGAPARVCCNASMVLDVGVQCVQKQIVRSDSKLSFWFFFFFFVCCFSPFWFRLVVCWDAVTAHLTRTHGALYAVLNMANAYVPGGGYTEGMVAQVGTRSTLGCPLAPEFVSRGRNRQR
jgi:hypothetical protein